MSKPEMALIINEIVDAFMNVIGAPGDPISKGTVFSYLGQKVEIFTTSGTWTKPAGVKIADVLLVGGGGAGGLGGSGGLIYNWTMNNFPYGDTYYYVYSAGRGGASGGRGAQVQDYIDVSGLSSVPITIGAGGTTGAGGLTSFGSFLSASGGGLGSSPGNVSVNITPPNWNEGYGYWYSDPAANRRYRNITVMSENVGSDYGGTSVPAGYQFDLQQPFYFQGYEDPGTTWLYFNSMQGYSYAGGTPVPANGYGAGGCGTNGADYQSTGNPYAGLLKGGKGSNGQAGYGYTTLASGRNGAPGLAIIRYS